MYDLIAMNVSSDEALDEPLVLAESQNYRKSFTPFLPATVFRGPFRVREFVRVR